MVPGEKMLAAATRGYGCRVRGSWSSPTLCYPSPKPVVAMPSTKILQRAKKNLPDDGITEQAGDMDTVARCLGLHSLYISLMFCVHR